MVSADLPPKGQKPGRKMRNEDGNDKGQPSPCGTSFAGEAGGLSRCNGSVRPLLVALVSSDFYSSLWSSLRTDRADFRYCHVLSKRSCRRPVAQAVPLPEDAASTSQQDPARDPAVAEKEEKLQAFASATSPRHPTARGGAQPGGETPKTSLEMWSSNSLGCHRRPQLLGKMR